MKVCDVTDDFLCDFETFISFRPTTHSHTDVLFCAGEVQAFHEDLIGRQYINGVYKFGVDKMYDLLFTESEFMRDFRGQRRFTGKLIIEDAPLPSPLSAERRGVFLGLFLFCCN